MGDINSMRPLPKRCSSGCRAWAPIAADRSRTIAGRGRRCGRRRGPTGAAPLPTPASPLLHRRSQGGWMFEFEFLLVFFPLSIYISLSLFLFLSSNVDVESVFDIWRAFGVFLRTARRPFFSFFWCFCARAAISFSHFIYLFIRWATFQSKKKKRKSNNNNLRPWNHFVC